MKTFQVYLVILMLVGCGGSDPSGSNNDGEEPPPRCELNADCPQNSTPFCVGGVCLIVSEVPTCSAGEPCSAGYHCGSDGFCAAGCQVDGDCCPEGEDCSCPGGPGCDQYTCVSEGRCRSDVSVCTDCSDGWQCLDTAPECFLAGLCIFPSDCSGGLICVDDGACGPCEVDEQCPDQICESGVCTDPAPPDPVDPGGPAVNRTCADDAECDAFDGVRKCSTTQDPRRCTKSCSNNGQCRSDGFNTCTNGECTGMN